MKKILVVDDELGIRNLLCEILEEDGYSVITAEDAQECRNAVATNKIDLILLDIWMPDTDGVTLLKELCTKRAINCPVIMMSGHGTIETAMEATRFGACDFLEKPITLTKLLDSCARAIENWNYDAENRLRHLPPIGTRYVPTPDEKKEAAPAQTSHAEASKLNDEHHVVFKAPDSDDNEPFVIDIDNFNITTDEPLPVFVIKPLNMTIDLNKPFREFSDDMELFYLTNVLTKKNGAVIELSRHSQLERTHLYRKLRNLNIDPNTCTHEAFRQQHPHIALVATNKKL